MGEIGTMSSYDKEVRIPISDEKYLKGVTVGTDTTVTVTGKIIELEVPREESLGDSEKYFRAGRIVISVDKVTMKGKTDNVGELVMEGMDMECD